MDNYDGYLSTSIVAVYDKTSQIHSGSIKNTLLVVQDFAASTQSMVKINVTPLIGDIVVIPKDGKTLDESKLITEDFRDGVPVSKMVKINTVPLQADFTPPELPTQKEYAGTIVMGLVANVEYTGLITGVNETEIKYIYRTVGSPRRYPLENSWQKSKSEETIIIDEVDGDVDE